MRLHHACAICSSRKNADRFYVDILGLTETKAGTLTSDLSEQIFGVSGECGVVLYAADGIAIEVLIPAGGRPASSPFSHACIEVANRDELLRRCEDAGLDVKRVPKGDSVVAFIEDCDGNAFEVKG